MEKQVLVDDAASSSEDEQPRGVNWMRGAMAVASLLGTAGAAKVGAGLVGARDASVESMQLPPHPAMVILDELTTSMNCLSIRKGAYVMIKERPCKVVGTTTTGAGKHGQAKIHIAGLDVFNGKKYEDIKKSSEDCDVPLVKTKDYQIIGIEK